mgnify:CR=1 FL=1
MHEFVQLFVMGYQMPSGIGCRQQHLQHKNYMVVVLLVTGRRTEDFFEHQLAEHLSNKLADSDFSTVEYY